ncbi:MAG TPA: hypothetical protein VGR15_03645 [Bacteroidota bacterium]|jgi:hypothetical protein|nr:hypothetical protein [Bacteroidota bacterium]
MIPSISIVVGLALLFAGRKIFWLAVAAIGFIAVQSKSRKKKPQHKEESAATTAK